MLRKIVSTLSLVIALAAHAKSDWILQSRQTDAFPIAQPNQTTTLRYHPDDAKVVSIAAQHLSQDLQSVSGQTPQLLPSYSTHSSQSPTIYIGTLGQCPLIDSLIEAQHIDASQLAGLWESFLITTFPDSTSSAGTSLAIIGSDRRGTAFGVYELSQAIGVSPWNWWADVNPEPATELWIQSGTHRFGPPSVKYRGIFINDEDWGLHPWAAHTFDPELGDIGPKTYEKVFELLLRLKANTLWPAMHEVTQAFNLYPENKTLADDYAIVMGSSHAEPMLRNNVTEWTADKSNFNFATHPAEVTDYWEQRVSENAAFENIYTLGMRGIHDSGMTGAASMDDKIAALSRIFEAQRALLAKHISTDLTKIPQAFTPYKEVLDIYRAGLAVPEEVTLVWPDDNHGYIRYLPNEAERQRSGGSGVYYHLSYLGSPLAYLWLSTMQPALIWEEMNKAYQLGAQDLWIANVGDIKPAEISTELFLQMAWDIDRWNLDTLPDFLETWAAREFGPTHAPAIANILAAYYQLNHQRRPEHLQWWLPHTRAKSSPLTGPETKARLQDFAELIADTDSLAAQIPPRLQDAFFQLVAYPAKASAFANLRYFHNEQHGRLFNANPAAARSHATRARYADSQITSLTNHYNHDIADGKWNRIMAAEPADSMWRSYRLTPLPLPAENMAASDLSNPFDLADLPFSPKPDTNSTIIQIEAEAFTQKHDTPRAYWTVIPHLGRSGDSVTAYPVDTPSLKPDQESPYLEYTFQVEEAGHYQLQADLLPTFPLNGQTDLRLAFSIDDAAPVLATTPRNVNDDAWKDAVLSASVKLNAPAPFTLTAGSHRLRIHFVDPGVTIDQIFLFTEKPQNSLLGPQL